MRKSSTSLIILGALLVAPADAADASLEARIVACASTEDAVDRLACFDSIAGGLQRPSPAAPAAQNPEAAFGEEFLRRDEPEEPRQGPTSIASTIARIERRPRGEHVFHLTNGQVWTELEVGRVRYEAGTPVTIERTTFGSYMLSTESGRATRVRRVE